MGSVSRVRQSVTDAPWAFLSIPYLFPATYSIVRGLEVWGLLSKLEYSSCTLEYTPMVGQLTLPSRVPVKPSKTG